MTKPGIIYGNAITVIAGFLLASKGHINLSLLIVTIIGVSLVIGSACVLNNIIDRDIDKEMSRTSERALVKGTVPVSNAIGFAFCLSLFGFALLAIFVNSLVVYIGIFAILVYVVLYGISKRLSVHGTLVGSLSGAAPILAGYCAVTNQIDSAAAILFIILVVWQMPHFYAIAIYRLKDYKAAKLPVLPAVKGITATKMQILIYTVIFLVAALSLRFSGYTGNIYLTVMTIICIIWINMARNGLKDKASEVWARGMFRFSLIVLLVFCALISINSWIA